MIHDGSSTGLAMIWLMVLMTVDNDALNVANPGSLADKQPANDDCSGKSMVCED